MNLATLIWKSVAAHGDRPALAKGDEVLCSFSEFAKRISSLAAGMQKKFNLSPGDRVALAMKNCPEYWEVLFACWHAGLTAVPMNAKLHAKEFEYILGNSGTKLCFVSSGIDCPFGNSIPVPSKDFQNLQGEPQNPHPSGPADVA